MEKAVDFEKAVQVFGGYSGLARQLKLRLSTVHGWHRRDRLPPWRAQQIALLARKKHKDVFKDEPTVKVKRKRRPRVKRIN